MTAQPPDITRSRRGPRLEPTELQCPQPKLSRAEQRALDLYWASTEISPTPAAYVATFGGSERNARRRIFAAGVRNLHGAYVFMDEDVDPLVAEAAVDFRVLLRRFLGARGIQPVSPNGIELSLKRVNGQRQIAGLLAMHLDAALLPGVSYAFEASGAILVLSFLGRRTEALASLKQVAGFDGDAKHWRSVPGRVRGGRGEG